MTKLGVNVAVMQAGQILLTKREDFEVWCLPGGEVEAGESFAQAALRETLEETGLEVRLTRLVGTYSRLGFLGDFHTILFVARPIGGELRLQAGETVGLGWFRADTIPTAILAWDRQRIEDALQGVGQGVAWVQQLESPWADDEPSDL